MPNMTELVRQLAEGAWLFDPQSDNQPLGFVTKNKDNNDQKPYLILWYYNNKTDTPVRVTYEFCDLVKYLQPSYAPYLCTRPIQWIPVYPNFVKEHYPKILENHIARNHKAFCLELALKKIHNATDPANSTPPKSKPKPINYSFKVVCTVDSWDTGVTTNLSYETLKVSARDYLHALEIASKHFNAPERDPHIIANTSEFTARWYSDDACEEIGSEITISISTID